MRTAAPILSLLLLAATAFGQEALSDSVGPDDIVEKLKDAEDEKEAHLEGPLSGLEEAWREFRRRLDEEAGLTFGAAFTAVYQWADVKKGGGGYDVDLFGRWALLGRESGYQTTIGFELEGRGKIGNRSAFDLGEAVGSLWGTTDAFDEQTFSPTQVWWDQVLVPDGLGFRVGKIDAGNYYDSYEYGSSDFFFLNEAFAWNPTIAYPGNGLGIAIDLEFSDELTIAAGFQDANGDRTGLDFSRFFEEREYFSAAKLSWKPEIKGLGMGRYHLTVWHSDERVRDGQEAGRGVAVTLNQEFGLYVNGILRYSQNDGRATDVRRMAVAEIIVEAPGDALDDVMGVGVAWGQPTDGKLRDQATLEIFYRYQLLPRLRLTPDLQVIVNPSGNPDRDVIAVIGLRGRITF